MTDILGLLWTTSLTLAATALVWMGSLIVARVLRERNQAARAQDRSSVARAYLQVMSGDPDGETHLRAYDHRARLLAESLLEVMGLVRGAERERLVATLKRLGVDDRLRERLTRGSRTGRLAAAEALAAFPSAATQDALGALHCGSDDADVRIAAIRSLIDIGAAPSVDVLVADLERRGETDSLQHLPILRKLTSVDSEAALKVFMNPALSTTLRAVLAEALASSGSYACLPALINALGDADATVRTAAARGLGQMGHPAATAAIGAAIRDPAWDVRAEACASAGKLGGASLASGLQAALEDPEWWVRFRAAEALSSIGANTTEPARLDLDQAVDVPTQRQSSRPVDAGVGR